MTLIILTVTKFCPALSLGKGNEYVLRKTAWRGAAGPRGPGKVNWLEKNRLLELRED